MGMLQSRRPPQLVFLYQSPPSSACRKPLLSESPTLFCFSVLSRSRSHGYCFLKICKQKKILLTFFSIKKGTVLHNLVDDNFKNVMIELGFLLELIMTIFLYQMQIADTRITHNPVQQSTLDNWLS